MNKKGAFETILNFFRLLFLIVVFFSLYFLVRAFITQHIDTFETESNLLTNRIFLSKELNYYDQDIKRLYPGIIDLEKFTSQDFERNILNSIYYGKINSEASAKITLLDIDSGGEYVYEAYYNKDLYNEKKVLVEAKLIGKGSAQRLDSNFYVLIKGKDKLKRGMLKIEAILPNI